MLVAVAMLFACSSLAAPARIRPGGDPPSSQVIWADPFDNYSQWAKDNGEDWPGGPTPAGINGGYVLKGGTNNNGCAGEVQWAPEPYDMLRARWTPVMQCGVQTSKRGQPVEPGTIDAAYAGDDHCADAGDPLGTTSAYWAVLNQPWGGSSAMYSSLQQFQYDLKPRIHDMDLNRGGTGTANAVYGTDADPLVFTFYLLDDTGSDFHGMFDNMYVELSLDDDHAPTDFVWRGDPAAQYPNPEYCPQGPYPLICQQVREINSTTSENGDDLSYLNSHCPPLVPAFDSQTGQGKTWKSIAFGLMAVMDKDPCGNFTAGADAHTPTTDHYAVFDGHAWRQIRSGRYTALNGLSPAATAHQSLPFPPDTSMTVGSASCNGFFILPGTTRVFIKITSDYMLIYADNLSGAGPDSRYPAWHAAVPRIYKGPFNSISIGVGPGCELDSATYTCKTGGTPRQCLMLLEPPRHRVIADSPLTPWPCTAATWLPATPARVVPAVDLTARAWRASPRMPAWRLTACTMVTVQSARGSCAARRRSRMPIMTATWTTPTSAFSRSATPDPAAACRSIASVSTAIVTGTLITQTSSRLADAEPAQTWPWSQSLTPSCMP